MKNYLLIGLFLLTMGLPDQLHAQLVTDPLEYYDLSGKTFQEAKTELDAYFDELKLVIEPSVFEEEGSPYFRYLEFIEYCQGLLKPSDKFDDYFLAKSVDAASEFCQDTGLGVNAGDWCEIGPRYASDMTLTPNAPDGIGPLEFVQIYLDNINQTVDEMLAFSKGGGLFLSHDGGASWNNSGSDDWSMSRVNAATFSPNDPDKLYASSYEGFASIDRMGVSGGIYRRMTAISNWVRIADYTDFPTLWTTITKLSVSPNNPSKMFVSTFQGLYSHTNIDAASAGTWDTDPNVTRVLDNYKILDFEFHPTNANVMYLMAQDVNADITFYISEDAGITWNPIANQPNYTDEKFIAIEVSAATPDLLYANMVRTTSYKSQLSVLDYSLLNSNPTLAWEKRLDIVNAPVISSAFGSGHGFAVSNVLNSQGDISVFLARGTKISRSVDGGYTWTNGLSNSGAHDDFEDIVTDPFNSNKVWGVHHGSLSYSTASGDNWQFSGDGLGVAMVHGFGPSYTDPERMFLALHHNSFTMSDNADGCVTTDWYVPFGAPYQDGWGALVDYDDPSYMYGRVNSSLLHRWQNDGLTHDQLSSHTLSSPTRMSLNKVDPTILYTNGNFLSGGSTDVNRSTNRGANPVPISDFENTHSAYTDKIIWQIESTRANADWLYVLMTDNGNSRVFRTKVANDPDPAVIINNWRELSHPSSISGRPIQGIILDQDDPNKVYFIYGPGINNLGPSNELVLRVDYTSNGAMQGLDCNGSPDCEDLTSNLPNVYLGLGVVERGSDDAVYIDTDCGIYYTNNALGTNYPTERWEKLGAALPHTNIRGMEINYASNELRVAFNGRGVWEHALYCPDDYNLHVASVTGPIEFFEVQNEITSNATINAGLDITYRGGKSVVLQPGFQALIGSDFHAFIHGCSSPGNSFKSADPTAVEETTESEENSLTENGGLTIFPNPNNGVFTIVPSSLELEEATYVEVYNLMGERILIQEYSDGSKIDIDISDQPNAIYLVKFTNGDTTIIERVVKQ